MSMSKIFSIFRKLNNYERFLYEEEKSDKTIQKYIAEVNRFKNWLQMNHRGIMVSKSNVLKYKAYLLTIMSVKSVGGNLSSLASYFKFIRRYDLIVKRDKSVKKIFINYEKMLTKADVIKLINIAIMQSKIRLVLIITFIVNTGVRVSELQYITIEHLKTGIAYVKGKNKHREVIIPNHLCKALLKYCKFQHIKKYVFTTKFGKFDPATTAANAS